MFDQFDNIKIEFSNIEIDPVLSDENVARLRASYKLSLTSFKEEQIYYPSGVLEFTFKSVVENGESVGGRIDHLILKDSDRNRVAKNSVSFSNRF